MKEAKRERSGVQGFKVKFGFLHLFFAFDSSQAVSWSRVANSVFKTSAPRRGTLGGAFLCHLWQYKLGPWVLDLWKLTEDETENEEWTQEKTAFFNLENHLEGVILHIHLSPDALAAQIGLQSVFCFARSEVQSHGGPGFWDILPCPHPNTLK